MQQIETIIYSYYLHKSPSFNGVEKEEWKMGRTTVSEVRLSTGNPVKNFQELVIKSAHTAGANREFNLLFRGQVDDFKDKNEKTVIYPTICRPEIDPSGRHKQMIRTTTIQERWDKLNEYVKILRPKKTKEGTFVRFTTHFEEYYHALIQHYEISPTPLIDLTQSLRVAATFALQKKNTGYLYIIGMPHPHGSISHYIDIGMVLVKLQSVCPSQALRPHFQEGFLAGRLPFLPVKEAGDNIARRMIAKFRLDNTDGQFWSNGFTQIPIEALLPEKDEYKEYLETLKKGTDTNILIQKG